MRHILFRSVFFLIVLHWRRVNPLACVTGINHESSFEADLLKRAPGCEAWGYDYSVDSVRVPSLILPMRGTPSINLFLSSGDLRSLTTLSLRPVLTSNLGRLVGLTTTRRTIFLGFGHLIRSWSLMVRVLISGFPFQPPKIEFSIVLRYQDTRSLTYSKLILRVASLTPLPHSLPRMLRVFYPSAKCNSRYMRARGMSALTILSNGGRLSKQRVCGHSGRRQMWSTSTLYAVPHPN